MACVQLALSGQQRQSQRVLVVVWDEPALDGVGNGLIPLVVLVEDVAALTPGVLVDHQQRPVKKGSLQPWASYSSSRRRMVSLSHSGGWKRQWGSRVFSVMWTQLYPNISTEPAISMGGRTGRDP